MVARTLARSTPGRVGGFDEPLSAYTPSMLRNRWDALLTFFQLPCKSALGGATPGSLRGSAATDFYIHTEDIARIAWRGRWRSLNTLDYYLQESSAQMFLTYLSAEARSKIATFASFSDSLVSLYCASGSPARWVSMLIVKPPAFILGKRSQIVRHFSVLNGPPKRSVLAAEVDSSSSEP